MWICGSCRTSADRKSSWEDAKGEPIPNVIKCERCGEDKVCLWFGPLIKSFRQQSSQPRRAH